MKGISEGMLNFPVGGYWAACAAVRMRASKSGWRMIFFVCNVQRSHLDLGNVGYFAACDGARAISGIELGEGSGEMLQGSADKVDVVGMAKIGGKDGGGGKRLEVLGEERWHPI
jgi:hypothetical protein